jgi:hypothetical protein
LPSTANVADVLTKPLNSKIFYGLMKEYLFRKPKTVAGFVRRVNTIVKSKES